MFEFVGAVGVTVNLNHDLIQTSTEHLMSLQMIVAGKTFIAMVAAEAKEVLGNMLVQDLDRLELLIAMSAGKRFDFIMDVLHVTSQIRYAPEQSLTYFAHEPFFLCVHEQMTREVRLLLERHGTSVAFVFLAHHVISFVFVQHSDFGERLFADRTD